MHDVAWHGDVDCVRSKDAQKQLARTSLKYKKNGKYIKYIDNNWICIKNWNIQLQMSLCKN